MTNTTKWFQYGPTTHLTSDGETSLCGKATVNSRIGTHDFEDVTELNVCELCKNYYNE